MGYYVTVEPNVYVYVEDIHPEGDKTILFLHGWPANHRLFEYQFNQLPKLGYRCIGVDMRGFGQSARPWSGYGYDRLADDVRAVMDALQLEHITLGGHSTGGAVAIRYMARHGGHGVDRLALFAAAAPSLIRRENFPHGLPAQAVEDIIRTTYRDRPAMLQNFGHMLFHNYVTPGIADWVYGLGMQAASWATAAIAETWLKEELFRDLGAIRVPTLILQGVEDQVCEFALAVAQKNGIPGSTLVPLASCGHFLFYDQMERFNQELVKFTSDG